MTVQRLTRRDVLKAGSVSLAVLFSQIWKSDFVFPGEEDEEELVSFLNMPRAKPNRLDWETLESWNTPQDQVFSVSHYPVPEVDPEKYKLEITGLVEKPKSLTLEEIKALPAKEQWMTLECSGNGSSRGFMDAIYNSQWTGTQLAPLLRSCVIEPEAKEVVFFGADRKEEKIRNVTVEVPFARSMSVEDALRPVNLLTYLRNGKPLEKRNGAPLRLIAPGWYGIANVKWLTRIEFRDRRFMGRFMGRDYVTLRGERRGDEIVHVETSVTRMNLKSIVARVTRRKIQDGLVPIKAYGAVWSDGTLIKKVEVKVDDGPWREAKLAREPRAKYSWIFFSIDLGGMKPGKHTVVSRAIDRKGRVQPTAEEDEIALKKTYWEAYQQWPREIELEA